MSKSEIPSCRHLYGRHRHLFGRFFGRTKNHKKWKWTVNNIFGMMIIWYKVGFDGRRSAPMILTLKCPPSHLGPIVISGSHSTIDIIFFKQNSFQMSDKVFLVGIFDYWVLWDCGQGVTITVVTVTWKIQTKCIVRNWKITILVQFFIFNCNRI